MKKNVLFFDIDEQKEIEYFAQLQKRENKLCEIENKMYNIGRAISRILNVENRLHSDEFLVKFFCPLKFFVYIGFSRAKSNILIDIMKIVNRGSRTTVATLIAQNHKDGSRCFFSSIGILRTDRAISAREKIVSIVTCMFGCDFE